MELSSAGPPLVVVVGSGGVGKTTLAASFGLLSAGAGHDTLVMTFDPSLRLKDALGVGERAREAEVAVEAATEGVLAASLLDARRTFDRLVERYAPGEEVKRRILANRYYDHLAGHLGGILEYMAVERLYEVAEEGRYQRVILDTPPTRQAIDFLGAPQRIVDFLDSGALKLALRPWFDEEGRLRVASRLGMLGRGLERFVDRVVGLELLRDMTEFFQAFEPLFDGFRRRARKVGSLLASRETVFVLVTGPGEERIPDTLFFARRLEEAGYRLGPIVVNKVHPEAGEEEPGDAAAAPGRRLFRWLGRRDREGLAKLRELVEGYRRVVAIPLEPDEPTDLEGLAELGRRLAERL